MRRPTLVVVASLLALAACHTSRKAPPVPPQSASTGAPSTVPASTTSSVQISGVRTVLSPLGLNVRAAGSKSAPIEATAAQGATFTVLGHTDQGGGWFQVKGATVTGWITDDARLTAPGTFTSYSSSQHQFTALYPGTWTFTEIPPAGVVFHPRAGDDSVVVTTAPTVGPLGQGRTGYQRGYDTPVVVCGVTGDLVTYTELSTSSSTTRETGGVVPGRYLAQVRLTLDAQHALGIDANLADLAGLPTVRTILDSVSFPFPQCEK